MGTYEYVCDECGARHRCPVAYRRRGRVFCSTVCRDLYLREGPAMPTEEMSEIVRYLRQADAPARRWQNSGRYGGYDNRRGK